MARRIKASTSTNEAAFRVGRLESHWVNGEREALLHIEIRTDRQSTKSCALVTKRFLEGLSFLHILLGLVKEVLERGFMAKKAYARRENPSLERGNNCRRGRQKQ